MSLRLPQRAISSRRIARNVDRAGGQVGPITVDRTKLPNEEEVFGERTSILFK
jgi:catabolite regulation protein CreA